MAVLPSWKQGFARYAGESQRPNLWRGFFAGWVPGLGPTGFTLLDIGGRNFDLALTNIELADWIPSTNRRSPGHAIDYNGTDEYAFVASPIVTDYPWSVHVVFKLDTLPSVIGDEMSLFAISDGINAFTDFWNLRVDDGEPNKLQFNTREDSGTTQTAQIPITLAIDTWYSAAVVATSPNTRSVFLNGTNKVSSDPASSPTPQGLTHTSIATVFASSASQDQLNGQIPATLFWTRSLTDDEVLDLHYDTLAMLRLQDDAVGLVPSVVSGRIMSSLVAHGGLAAEGGIAGVGGGLAG